MAPFRTDLKKRFKFPAKHAENTHETQVDVKKAGFTMTGKIMEAITLGGESPEDLEILNEIEEKVIKKIDLGFDPHVLEILDDEEITRMQIEPLKDLLSKGVVTRLFGLGNSIYYGRMRAGKSAHRPNGAHPVRPRGGP